MTVRLVAFYLYLINYQCESRVVHRLLPSDPFKEYAANKDDEITVLHEPSHTFSSNGVKGGLYSNYKNNFNDDLSGSIQEYKFKYASKPKLEYNTNTIDRIDNDSFETQVISGNYQVPNINRKSQIYPYPKRRRQNFNSINDLEPYDKDYRKKLWSSTNTDSDKRRKRNRRPNSKKFIKTVGWKPTSGGGEFTNWIEDVNYRYPRRYSDVQPVFKIPMDVIDDDYSKFTSKDISDYDAEYDLLPNKKARKRRPKNNKPNKNNFWMNDQMQKVKHHTKGINLESPLDPKQVGGFVPTGLGDGISIGFRNTERNQKQNANQKSSSEVETKNDVVNGWKYWDDLPEKYRSQKKRQFRIKNKRRKAKWRKQQKYLQSLHDIQNEIPSKEEHYEIHYEELPRHGSEFGIPNGEPNSGPRKRQRGNWNSLNDEVNVPVSRPERKRRRRKRPLSFENSYDYTIVKQYTKPRRNKLPYLRRAKGSSHRWNN